MEKALIEVVKDRYEYRDGGLWVKRIFNSKVSIGKRSGSVLNDGYRQLRINRKNYREHHIVWLLHKGVMPSEIDHINCIRDDNRIENLRECTRLENMQNRKVASIRSKSGFLGVFERHGRYHAEITRDGKRACLGIYETPEEASLAYLAYKEKYEAAVWAKFAAVKQDEAIKEKLK